MTTATASTMLDAALGYAAAGLYVFPCSGKLPAIPKEKGGSGHLDATTDPNVIAQWWAEYPYASIGIACTADTGVLVMDVDPRNEGHDSYYSLMYGHDEPDTLTSDTPSGGWHLYFQHPGGWLPGTAGKGIDLKHNGYAIAAPSPGYAWRDESRSIAPMPDWLLEELRRAEPGTNGAGPREYQKLSATVYEGQGRHNAIVSYAGRAFVDGMDAGVLAEVLGAVNATQCAPPLPDSEIADIAAHFVAKREPQGGSAYIEGSKKTTRAKGKGEPLSRAPVLVTLSDVQRENVEWLWKHRIPRGKMTVIEGDPGVAKSWLTMALATAVTTATALPGDYAQRAAQRVLILTAEDGLGDTVRPRVEDMGGDLTLISVLTAVRDEQGRDRFPSLSDDLTAIEEAIRGEDYGLIIIDPINAYLGGVDGHRDIDVRSVLGPVAQLAERHDVAVVFVRHITKGGRDKSIYRGAGSIAYTGAARSALLVGLDPDNPETHVVACHKHNLAPDSPSIAFVIEDGRFLWRGETTVTADAMLAVDAGEGDRNARDEATDFLMVMLSDGPRAALDVLAQASKMGISRSTLKRARSSVGVSSRRVGGVGPDGWWEWALVDAGLTKETTSPYIENVSPLADSEAKAAGDDEGGDPLSGGAEDDHAGRISAALNGYANIRPIAANGSKPRCTRCGTGMSVAALGVLCGRCVGMTI